MSVFNDANDIASLVVFGKHYGEEETTGCATGCVDLMFIKGDATEELHVEGEATHELWASTATKIDSLLSRGFDLIPRWVLYDSACKDDVPGSVADFLANDVEHLVEQVVPYLEKQQSVSDRGYAAQEDLDFSNVVLFHPDRIITVMVSGMEHKYIT